MKTEISVNKMNISFAPNPFGSGWVMLCRRGIACENHVQVISTHTTNTPPYWAMEKSIAYWYDDFYESINGFVESVHAWNKKSYEGDAFDPIGILTCFNWCKRIVEYAEKLYGESGFKDELDR